MGINRTFGFSENPQEEPLGISNIEKDKHKKKEEEEKNEKDNFIIESLLLHFLKEVLFHIGRDVRFHTVQSQIIIHLKKFKKYLEELKHQDRSYQIDFVESLSFTWHELIQDLVELQLTQTNKGIERKKLKNFMDKIRHYPTESDLSLGYYFTEFVGKEWAPKPFLDILSSLHKEYQNHPHHSSLTLWVEDLTMIIEKFF